jgi:hypothetical protein
MVEDPLPVIKASELAEFDFCQRAWWMQHVQGVVAEPSQSLLRGQKHHTTHYRQLQIANYLRQASFGLFGVGLLILLAVLWASLG